MFHSQPKAQIHMKQWIKALIVYKMFGLSLVYEQDAITDKGFLIYYTKSLETSSKVLHDFVL